MKKMTLIVSAICLASFLLSTIKGYGQTQINQVTISDTSFKAFLLKWEEAVTRFMNGDATLWKQICSQSDDATIFGGFGGYEKGWNKLGARYDWAASQFKESGTPLQVEYINVAVSGDLSYIVVIERSQPRVGNMEKAVPLALRSTQIFRKEDGEWKLLHRHADALMEKKPGEEIHSQ